MSGEKGKNSFCTQSPTIINRQKRFLTHRAKQPFASQPLLHAKYFYKTKCKVLLSLILSLSFLEHAQGRVLPKGLVEAKGKDIDLGS